MDDQDKAMSMMPSGWGAPEVFFQKYLKAQKSNPEPSLEDVLYAEDGMKSPKTREEFVNQHNLPSDYFTTDNTTRGKYNDEWRKRKAITLSKEPELYTGSKDIQQPVTAEYPLPPVQFDLSRVGRFGDGDKLPTARKAEERYANSTFLTTEHPLFSTSMRFNPKAYHEGVLQTKPAWNYRPAWITMEVSGNDTTYRERPEQKMGFNRTVVRQASNSDSNRSEYRTLQRRFNTAKGIAKQPEVKEETKSAPVSFTSFLKHMFPGFREAYNQKVVAKHQLGTTKGGIVERSDNTRVQKPIPSIIDKNSEVRTYDGYPVRVNKNYPQQDKYQLEATTRKYHSPFGGEMNVKYPWIYGVEVTSLGPEYIQKIFNNDTTYYTRGYDSKYYRVAGQELRPIFKESFKNPKEAVTSPNYFNTPEKIEKMKQVIANWNK